MSGIRMIWIMTVEGLLKTDWLGILGVIAPPIISAWVAYQIARYQIDTQLKKQNELEVQKENRMLVTKIRLSKYEEFYVFLQEYITLSYQRYKNTYLYDTNSMPLKKFEELESDLDSKRHQIYFKLRSLIAFCPALEDSWEDLFWSYVNLDRFIMINITNPKENNSEKDNIDLSETELDDLYTQEYRAYIGELKAIRDDFQAKENELNKLINDSILNIMNDLESDL